MDFILLLSKRVFGTTYDCKVRISAFVQPDGYFELHESFMVVWVLHLFDDDTFLHLTDVLILDHCIQAVKILKNEGRVKVVIFGSALLH